MYIKAFTVGLVMISFWATASGKSLDSWVTENLAREETLLCKRETDGDFFLIAQVADGLKTGYRIDVTSESEIPRTFVIGWRFQDDSGRSLGRAKEPIVLSSAYSRSGDRLYAEEFVIRDVPVDAVESVHVIVSLSKYRDRSEAPRSGSVPELEKVVECMSRPSEG